MGATAGFRLGYVRFMKGMPNGNYYAIGDNYDYAIGDYVGPYT